MTEPSTPAARIAEIRGADEPIEPLPVGWECEGGNEPFPWRVAHGEFLPWSLLLTDPDGDFCVEGGLREDVVKSARELVVSLQAAIRYLEAQPDDGLRRDEPVWVRDV